MTYNWNNLPHSVVERIGVLLADLVVGEETDAGDLGEEIRDTVRKHEPVEELSDEAIDKVVAHAEVIMGGYFLYNRCRPGRLDVIRFLEEIEQLLEPVRHLRREQ